MAKESDIILQSYAKEESYNYEMQDYTIKYHEGNFICWDDIYVFLKIQDNIIIEYSFSGNTSIVSKASANFLHEMIIGKNLSETLEIEVDVFSENKLEVSIRRKNALHLPLLAIRNAIHEYQNDWEIEDFDDLE